MELLTCPVGWCEFFLFGGVNSSGIWSYRRGSIPGVWWMLFGVEHRLESGVGEEAWCGGDGTSSCVTLTRGDLAHDPRIPSAPPHPALELTFVPASSLPLPRHQAYTHTKPSRFTLHTCTSDPNLNFVWFPLACSFLPRAPLSHFGKMVRRGTAW